MPIRAIIAIRNEDIIHFGILYSHILAMSMTIKKGDSNPPMSVNLSAVIASPRLDEYAIIIYPQFSTAITKHISEAST